MSTALLYLVLVPSLIGILHFGTKNLMEEGKIKVEKGHDVRLYSEGDFQGLKRLRKKSRNIRLLYMSVSVFGTILIYLLDKDSTENKVVSIFILLQCLMVSFIHLHARKVSSMLEEQRKSKVAA